MIHRLSELNHRRSAVKNIGMKHMLKSHLNFSIRLVLAKFDCILRDLREANGLKDNSARSTAVSWKYIHMFANTCIFSAIALLSKLNFPAFSVSNSFLSNILCFLTVMALDNNQLLSIKCVNFIAYL